MSILAEPAVAEFLAAHSRPAPGPPPVAVFDCDGTLIQGDIGEAMFYRQIEHFTFRRSPALLWGDHPGRSALAQLYEELAPLGPEERTAHPAFPRFADMLLSAYFDGIAGGNVAAACADIVRLFAGFSPAEVRAFAVATLNEELSAPLGTRRLGSRDLARGVRYLREAVELLGALAERGFEIWGCSGSNKWSVEPVFGRLGIPPEQVIGIELELRDGLLGDRALEPIPIRGGKIEAMRIRTSAIPLLAASDSKNDIPLFLYSAGLKVRVNSRKRDTADFFRTAKTSPDRSWVLVETPHIME